jgi:hypothetical protein
LRGARIGVRVGGRVGDTARFRVMVRDRVGVGGKANVNVRVVTRDSPYTFRVNGGESVSANKYPLT